MRRLLIGIALLLAACQSGTPAGVQEGSIINWNRDPNTVVFRADVAGGTQNEFLARNEIPLCTVYGDNRVVWTNDLGDFNVQVLWDKVEDQRIQDFVTYLTVIERIYTYEALADDQPPSEIEPVYEELTIFVNERLHKTDSFTTWDADYFTRIVDTCKTISPAPVLFEPEGAWISAREVPYDTVRPTYFWDGSAAGLRMSDLAAGSEPRWVTGNNIRLIWNTLRTSSPIVLFVEDEKSYEVVLEVPGIQPGVRPAP